MDHNTSNQVAKFSVPLQYRLVDIYQAKDDSGKLLDYWWLHVEKVELHTADSLHQRNMSFYQFANQQGLSAYDGMDVGPAGQ